ncbi:MAG TPA: helix-turn-helix domain-containing protein [Actinoplanes sp.]|nr:helix-turn-helix domain-containing protein [Actinoplanes sp.]
MPDLSIQEAADLLNVSRPYLIGLLEAGELGFRGSGGDRRVPTDAVLTYKAGDDARRRAAADELARLAREMDLT